MIMSATFGTVVARAVRQNVPLWRNVYREVLVVAFVGKLRLSGLGLERAVCVFQESSKSFFA